MTLGFLDVLNIVTYAEATTIALILLSRSRRSVTYLFLAGFIFTYMSGTLVPVLMRSGVSTRKLIWVFLIPTIVTLAQFYFWSFPSAEKLAHVADGTYVQVFYWFRGIAFLFSFMMIVITLQTAKRYQKKVDHFYSEGLPRGFRWVQGICYYLLAIMVPVMISPSAYPDGWFPYVSITFTILGIILILWVGVEGMNQEFMFLSYRAQKPYKNAETDPLVKSETARMNTGAGESQELIEIINNIRKHELFRSVDLNLNDLAESLNISPRRLSNIINQHAQKNFRNFINGFRVEYARKRLEEGVLQKMNMNGLALESGFKSRTTFYSAFKQEENCSPLVYLELYNSGQN